MATLRTTQTSFTAGELAPSVGARVELTRYYSGAQLLRNVLVRPQGGLRRRPGMTHVFGTDPSITTCRLIPFAFNTEQTYLIVLAATWFWVLRSDLSVLAWVQNCPWSATQAEQMNWAQSADTLLLTHPDLPPQRIRRGTVETSWTCDAPTLTNLPTVDLGSVTPTGTVTPSATTGTVTLTASASIFAAGQVGWELHGNGGRARITAVTNATTATATVGSPFSNTAAITAERWSLREPCISAARGWPECVTFHRGRLWFGGLKSLPASFMGSRIADFFDFDIGTAEDDDAIFGTIDSDQINAIHQLASGRALLVFTSGAELVVDPADGIITPKSFAVLEQTRRGIQRFARVGEVDGASLFVANGGGAVRQFLFSETEAAWRSDLTSLLAPHLIQSPVDVIVRKGSRQDDADHVMLPNRTPFMAIMTTLRAQEVAAFTRWETAGDIVDAAALTSGEVFFAVRRANTIRVEQWTENGLLDAAVIRTGTTPITTLTGTAHLTGTAALILDGAYAGDIAVNGASSVTLPRPATQVQLGLPFDVAVTTMPLEPRDPGGALLGRRTRLRNISLRVVATGPFQCQDQVLAVPRLNEPPGAVLDATPPRITGDLHLRGLLGWTYNTQVRIAQATPQPFELLALTATLEVAE